MGAQEIIEIFVYSILWILVSLCLYGIGYVIFYLDIFNIGLDKLFENIFRNVKSENEYIKEHKFDVSKYYERIEKAQLEILEGRKPVDKTIILWIGLDGLKLDENGETMWISRKKEQKPVDTTYGYIPSIQL